MSAGCRREARAACRRRRGGGRTARDPGRGWWRGQKSRGGKIAVCVCVLQRQCAVTRWGPAGPTSSGTILQQCRRRVGGGLVTGVSRGIGRSVRQGKWRAPGGTPKATQACWRQAQGRRGRRASGARVGPIGTRLSNRRRHRPTEGRGDQGGGGHRRSTTRQQQALSRPGTVARESGQTDDRAQHGGQGSAAGPRTGDGQGGAPGETRRQQKREPAHPGTGAGRRPDRRAGRRT